MAVKLLDPDSLRPGPRTPRPRRPAPSRLRPVARRRPEISVIVPALNECQSLGVLHEEITAALIGWRYEIIFVDDGSRDGTFEVMQALHRADRRVKVVRLRRNFGKTAALNAGFRRATGDIFVTLDADLQDDPAEIPRLIEELDKGHDLVVAWRERRHDRARKCFSSWLFNRACGWSAGLPLHDMNCGFKVFRRAVGEDLELYGEMHRFLPILAHGKGFRVTELAVRHRPRRFGISKYGNNRFLSGLLDFLKVIFLTRYVTRPLRLFGAAGVGLFALGLLLGGGLLVRQMSGATTDTGPLFYLALLLVAAGFQVISIGLIGELIRHLASRPGQEYTVAETLD